MSTIISTGTTLVLPRERDTRWQCATPASGNLDLDARRVELSAAGGVLRVEGVGLVERNNLDTKDILPLDQV